MKLGSPTAHLNLCLLKRNLWQIAQAGTELGKAVDLDPSRRAGIPIVDLPDLTPPVPLRVSKPTPARNSPAATASAA
jgi:hypothetical protein